MMGVRFRFKTFGFPIEAQVTEGVSPAPGEAARLAWHGWAEGDEETRLDVIHAWLIEDLSGRRVRILNQKTSKRLSKTKTKSYDTRAPRLVGRFGRSCKK